MIKQADNRTVSVGSISPLHGNCGVQKTALTGGFLFAPQSLEPAVSALYDR
jgi:hypothetical protein